MNEPPSNAGVDLTLTDGRITAVANTFAPDPGWPKAIRWDENEPGRIYVRFADGRWWTGTGFATQGQCERRIEPMVGGPASS